MPTVTLVDMKDEFKKGNRIFSELVISKINDRLLKNEQTIVFTEYISKLLHSGQGFPAFDWNSFLGMDFLTSYHDHIFSPFDWLMYAVPTGVMPYIHTVVMALKVGLSAVTAYIYCRQYVKKDQSAYLCGLLYAFSGLIWYISFRKDILCFR